MLGDTDVLIGTGMGVGTRRIDLGHEQRRVADRGTVDHQDDQALLQRPGRLGRSALRLRRQHLHVRRPGRRQIRWQKRGYGNGQVLLLADQHLLLVLSEEGEVALVEAKPEKHHEIARFKAIEGKTWNHPVIAHGKLLVRNGEEIACFALKPLADEPAQAKANEGEEKTPL